MVLYIDVMRERQTKFLEGREMPVRKERTVPEPRVEIEDQKETFR